MKRDAVIRALRTWWQGLTVAVLIAAWPVLSPLIEGDGTAPVDWGMVRHDLRLVAGAAVASYVQRTLVDPARSRRKARRVSGYLTADALDRDG